MIDTIHPRSSSQDSSKRFLSEVDSDENSPTLEEIQKINQAKIKNHQRRLENKEVSSLTSNYVEPQTKHLYGNKSRVTREDFIDHSEEEGSLWASNGQTNYYFTKNKVRTPGDLITLNIENELIKEMSAEIRKTLNYREKERELVAFQENKNQKLLSDEHKKETLNSSQNISSSPAPTPSPSNSAETISEESKNQFAKSSISDIDISKSLEVKVGDTMMGEILQRFPNGNYKIRTMKKIPYKNGLSRVVSVVGIVKATDVNEDTDSISSGKLYDYRLNISY